MQSRGDWVAVVWQPGRQRVSRSVLISAISSSMQCVVRTCSVTDQTFPIGRPGDHFASSHSALPASQPLLEAEAGIEPASGLCRPLPRPLGHSAVPGPEPETKGYPGAVLAIGTCHTALDASSAGPRIRTRDPHLGKVMLYH